MSENNKTEQTMEYIDFAPPSDVIENDHVIRLAMDMPGVSNDNLSVDLDDGILKVTADTSLDRNGKRVRYKRSFQVTDQIDANKITAKVCSGVLEVVMPKAEAAKVRKIQVAVE